jgi:3',5'-cyclic AMP phosphodiesterase CpdA
MGAGLLLHLSDVHLSIGLLTAQTKMLDCLRCALARELARRRAGADLVVITGDVFDSTHFDRREAERTFASFCALLRRAVGERVPILVQPGNHDRRRFGILGPHDPSLFAALSRSAGPFVLVHGNAAPFHAELVPREIHGLPIHLVTYDTTVLERGLFSAGGVIRNEDLLQVAAEIEAVEGDPSPSAGEGWPIVVLMHHHLVPTPFTDLDRISFTRLPSYLRWPIEEGLRRLVANADREELTMTALGSGTALSTLHTLGRAVLVLHGHKHHPVVRLLRGVGAGEGDVLIGSAGSAGAAQAWRQHEVPRQARIWPSFNVVTFDGPKLHIERVGFSDRNPNKPPLRATLIRALRCGVRWEPAPPPTQPPGPADLPIALNETVVQLSPSRGEEGLWDFHCERTVHGASGPTSGHHIEVVKGLPGGTFTVVGDGWVGRPLPGDIQVPRHGTVAYQVERAACRTAAAGRHYHGADTAHAWVGLFVRHGSARARIVLRGLPASPRRPFGSVTDLASGQERAHPLQTHDGALLLEEWACPARTLLRIYWPLET